MERYLNYVLECNQIIPIRVNAGLLALFYLGSAVLWALFGYKRGTKWSARLLLLEFLFWLIALTVLYRPEYAGRMSRVTPFWSYRLVQEGGHDLLLTQIIMNVVAFIPFGFLLGCSFRQMTWWKVAMFAVCFSILIETLQYFTKRGFAEFDDVFHNVMGAMIGYGMFVGLRWLIKRVRRERVIGA